MFSEQPSGDARYTAPESIFTRKGTRPFHPTVEIDEVLLDLVQQCLSAEKSRPSIEKVLYLVLVQSFGAADLTNLVQRPNKIRQAFGGFANVHRCKLYLRDNDAVQQVVSRYQFPSRSTCTNRLFREITLWLRLVHKNIVPLWGVVSLTGYLQREHKILSYNRKFALLEDVARGLQYLHSQSIIHGDLSGNNIVDKNGTASLTDFGLSAFLPDRMSQALLPTNHMCTVPYMAPEHLIFDDEDNISAVFTPKSDTYAFGGIMLQVLEGKVPYHYVRNQAAIINNISRGITPKRLPTSDIIDSDWDFMQTCWSRDMEHRSSDEDVLEFLMLPLYLFIVCRLGTMDTAWTVSGTSEVLIDRFYHFSA
ncbi:kinase-like domain-containing protein [Suillus subluteus]|nr:kinase-like domain-containing protein [Suillus subluteus]